MIIDDFGSFIAEMDYVRLPEDVTEAVKVRILDLLGAGLAGVQLKNTKQLLPILNKADEATGWGESQKLTLRDAVIFNSFASHSTYLEDGSRYTGGHPSSVVIPSVIAYAEYKNLTGRKVISAIAAGYELFLRLGRAIYPSTVERGFKSTAVLGAVSSAAGVAHLMGFDKIRAKNAIAIACNLGVGLKESLKASSSEPIQVARTSEAGLIAALFSGQGAEGASSIIENGFLRAFADDVSTEEILADLGSNFRIHETYLKTHGGCRGNHAPVDAIQDLILENKFIEKDISEIEVQVDSVTYDAEIHHPHNGAQAQFSVAFAIASVLLDGNASIFQYSDSKIADPRIRDLMSRIQVKVNKSLDVDYPDKRGAYVRVKMKNGEELSGSIDNAKGEPECPLSMAQIESKFITLSSGLLGCDASKVMDLVLNIDKVADVSTLMSLMNPRKQNLLFGA